MSHQASACTNEIDAITFARTQFFGSNKVLRDQFRDAFDNDDEAWLRWLELVKIEGLNWALSELELNPKVFGPKSRELWNRQHSSPIEHFPPDALLLLSLEWAHHYSALLNLIGNTPNLETLDVQHDFSEFTESKGWGEI